MGEDKELPVQNNEVLSRIANELRGKGQNIATLLINIQNIIVDHAHGMQYPYEAQSILESRFISPDEAYRRGMLSCGAMSNIGSSLLRNLGYQVRLVDGSVPGSRNHAWIQIKDGGGWKEYDLTNKGCLPREGRIIHNVCDNWENIRDIIERKHQENVSE